MASPGLMPPAAQCPPAVAHSKGAWHDWHRGLQAASMTGARCELRAHAVSPAALDMPCRATAPPTSGATMPKRMAILNIQQPRQKPTRPSRPLAMARPQVTASATYLSEYVYTARRWNKKARQAKEQPQKEANCFGGPGIHLQLAIRTQGQSVVPDAAGM